MSGGLAPYHAITADQYVEAIAAIRKRAAIECLGGDADILSSGWLDKVAKSYRPGRGSPAGWAIAMYRRRKFDLRRNKSRLGKQLLAQREAQPVVWMPAKAAPPTGDRSGFARAERLRVARQHAPSSNYEEDEAIADLDRKRVLPPPDDTRRTYAATAAHECRVSIAHPCECRPSKLPAFEHSWSTIPAPATGMQASPIAMIHDAPQRCKWPPCREKEHEVNNCAKEQAVSAVVGCERVNNSPPIFLVSARLPTAKHEHPIVMEPCHGS